MRHGDLGGETPDSGDEDLGFMHISDISRGSFETMRVYAFNGRNMFT
jgi:hypothetical protein